MCEAAGRDVVRTRCSQSSCFISTVDFKTKLVLNFHLGRLSLCVTIRNIFVVVRFTVNRLWRRALSKCHLCYQRCWRASSNSKPVIDNEGIVLMSGVRSPPGKRVSVNLQFFVWQFNIQALPLYLVITLFVRTMWVAIWQKTYWLCWKSWVTVILLWFVASIFDSAT